MIARRRGPAILVRVVLALAVVVLAVTATAPGARAQAPGPAGPGGPGGGGGAGGSTPPTSQLRLTDQSTWVGDGGIFNVGFSVTTPDPATARVQLTIYGALSSRSDFTETLSDRIHTPKIRPFDVVTLASLGPSPSMSFTVNPKASSHAAQSVHLFATGVYPVRIDLFGGDGLPLARLTTHLVYSGADATSITRLDVAWVAPFHAPPSTGATGSSGSSGSAGGPSADDAAALLGLSGALASHQNLPVTVTATPETVEGLASGPPTGRSVVAQLAQAVAAGAHQVVAAPYVRLDLPSMLAAGLESEVTSQLSTGTGVLASNLHVVPAGGTWIVSGALTPAAVDELAGRGVQRIVTAESALSPLPPEDRSRTLAQPFVLVGKTSRLAAMSVDAGLSVAFVPKADELLAAHQLLAQLAMIQLELPNRRGGRGVVVMPPAGWRPDATFLTTFLDGLGDAPMLTAVTVDELFTDVTPLTGGSGGAGGSGGSGPLVRSVASDPQSRSQSISDGAAIRAARRQVASMAAVVPASTPAIADIERHLLISESADLADRARPAEVAAANAEINHLKQMVRLPGNQSITFTARQGLIPITILSSAPFPMRVRLRVTSQKLGFQPVGLPGGSCTQAETSEICTVELRAENTTVRVPVVAKTAGVFSLNVALDSPDGFLNLASNQDTVRSTAASGVGVFLSIGAALLLAVWWVRNVIHGRRARRLIPREEAGFGWGAMGPGGAAVALRGGGGAGRGGPGGAGGAGLAGGRRGAGGAGAGGRGGSGGGGGAGGRGGSGGAGGAGGGGGSGGGAGAGGRGGSGGAGGAGGRGGSGGGGGRGTGPPGGRGGLRPAGARVVGPRSPGDATSVAKAAAASAEGTWSERVAVSPAPGPGVPGGEERPVAPDGLDGPDEPEDWLLASFGLDVKVPPLTRSNTAQAARSRGLPAQERDDEAARTTLPIPIIPVDMPSGAPSPALTAPAERGSPPTGQGPATDAEPQRSFSRNTAVMAAGTLLSRLTGFGRVLALIWAFGITTGVTDVYNVANTAPNIIYDLVLGGILSATLVPVFVDYFNHDDPDEGWRAISAVVTAITVTLVALTAVFWLLAPAIIRFYLVLNNTSNAADERAMGTTLLHLFVPQLFLLGGIAVSTALLNARRHFAAPAFSPVVNNVVVIGAIVGSRMVATSLTLPGFRRDQSALLILGLGTTAGYLFQFLVQLPPMFRDGFRLRPVWDLRHPAVRTVLRLSLWTFGSVMANQISFNLILVLAEQRNGDVTVFMTAYQFFQLPYAIFAVSIASVLTTELSEYWAHRDLAGFRRQMAAGLRLTMAVLVPAAVGYVVLAQPFLHLVLRHGSFSSGDAHRVAAVVALFALGLPGFSAYLLLMRAYQAMQDTRSMFWLYLIENLATLILAGVLYPILGVRGLALGWVSAYSVGSVIAFAHLRRRTGGLDGQAIVAGLVRVALATVLMTLPVFALTHLLKGHGDVVVATQVAAAVVIGSLVYLAAAQAFGVSELTELLRRRRGVRAP